MTNTPALDPVAIAKRCEAATPEPWHYDADRQGPSIVGPDGRVVLGSGWSETYGIAGEDADIAFVVHARSDVPALLAEVERHQQCIEATERKLDDMLYALVGGNIQDEPVDPVAIEDWITRVLVALRGGGGEERL